jgi:hypothetical protein
MDYNKFSYLLFLLDYKHPGALLFYGLESDNGLCLVGRFARVITWFTDKTEVCILILLLFAASENDNIPSMAAHHSEE